jgi:hypothetical protein
MVSTPGNQNDPDQFVLSTPILRKEFDEYQTTIDPLSGRSSATL